MFSDILAAPGPEPAPRPGGRGADAETILAAIDRMDAAIRRDRGVLDRLSRDLAAMARAVAQAKAALQAGAIKPDAATGGKPVGVDALLDELEHRLDTMIEAAGGDAAAIAHAATAAAVVSATAQPVEAPPPAPLDRSSAAASHAPEPQPPRPEPDHVPTVSDVVSRLGRTDDAPLPAAELLSAAAALGPGRDVPTVSMLEALVEALTAAPPQDAEQAPAAEEAAPGELSQTAIEAQAATVGQPEAPTPEPFSLTEEHVVAPAAPPDSDVPSAGERAEPATIAEPEPQFESEDAQDVAEPVVTAAAEAIAASDAVPEPAEPEVAPPESAATEPPSAPVLPDVDLLAHYARLEAFPVLPQEEVGTAVIFRPRQEPQEAAHEMPAQEMPAQEEPAQEMPAQTAPPEPEHEEEVSEKAEPSAPSPYDPLAPLKAMSEEERIALFG